MFRGAESFCECLSASNICSCRSKRKPSTPLLSGLRSSSAVLQVRAALSPIHLSAALLNVLWSPNILPQNVRTRLLLYSNCKRQFSVLNISLRCHFLLLLSVGLSILDLVYFLREDIKQPSDYLLDRSVCDLTIVSFFMAQSKMTNVLKTQKYML